MKMATKEPTRINPNDSGIDFSKSKKVENYIKKSNFTWSQDITPGPVFGDVFVLYVQNDRLKNLLELEEQRIIINIEKHTKIKLKKLNIQMFNNQQ